MAKFGEYPERDVICDRCGLVFKSRALVVKYCQEGDCKRARRRKSPVLIDKVCKQCTAPFQVFTTQAVARFCSDECRRQNRIDTRPDKAPIIDKICVECGAAFKGKKHSWRVCGETCKKKRRNRWGVAGTRRDPRKSKNTQLVHRYGITLDQYEAILRSQDGGCAVCGKEPQGTKYMPVDHDHACCDKTSSCGKCVRGVLCDGCNVALGRLNDDPETIQKLLHYVLGGGSTLVAGVLWGSSSA